VDTLTAVRPARLVTSALLIVSSLLGATGCGAGQVAQTATQGATQEGGNAERGGVAVRRVLIPAPLRGSYVAGEEAPLYLAISTEEGHRDTLVAVTSSAATSVVLVRSLLTQRRSASPSASSGTAVETPSAPSADESVRLDIGNGALVMLTQGMSYLEMRGLTRDLAPGTTVEATFSFSQAGDISLDVPVATPDTPGPRLTPSEGAEHE